jgi:hypothetical protein
MIRRLITPFIVIASIALAVSSNGGFPARPALADVPFVYVTGTLTNVGDAVTINNLVGQSSCSFFVTGTTGAIDVQGTNDKSATPAWTALATLDYASPPNVQSQPFSPTIGQAYQFSPTSLTRARVVADSTWAGGPAVVTISCSGSVARGNTGGGGGGGTVTGTEPITVASNNVGFDYGHAGSFSAIQAFGAAPALCGSEPVGTYWGSGGYGGYAYYNGGGFFLSSVKNNFSSGTCQVDNMIQFIPSNEFSNTPATLNFLGAVGSIFFQNFANGCLYVNGSGQLEVNTGSATCGTAVTAGTNMAFAGTALGTIPQPVFTNVDLTDASLQHPGNYVGLTSDGSGQVKFVALSPQPCPSTGCGVLAVAATEPLSSTGGTIPNISLNSPVPLAYGGFNQNTSEWPGGDCVLTTGSGFTPAPCPATSIPPYPSPSPGPSFTATSPLGSSSVGNVVTTFIASPIPAAYGGLGVNATSYTSGQCPVFNGTNFSGGTCGGGTYTAGTNISIASNVISVVAGPTFTGNTAVYNSGSGTGQFIVGAGTTCSASSVQICLQQSSNTVDFEMTVRVPPSTFYYCAIVPSTTTPFLLTFTGGGCTSQFNAVETTDLISSGPVSGTSITDSGLAASKTVCTTTGGALTTCGDGQFSCTISGATACSTTTTVAAGSVCNATYDHATTVTQTQLAPAEVAVSGTTLTMYAATTSTATGTVYFDAKC